MKKLIIVCGLISFLNCNSKQQDISRDVVVELPRSETPEDIARGWYIEKRLTVDGNTVTRINDHETKTICYVASARDQLHGAALPDGVAVSIYCIK